MFSMQLDTPTRDVDAQRYAENALPPNNFMDNIETEDIIEEATNPIL